MKINIPEIKKATEFFRQYKWILLILFAGIALLLIPGKEKDKTVRISPAEAELPFDLNELETRMERVLGEIDGIGELSLILTLKSGVEEIYAADREYAEDGEEYTEKTTTVFRSGTGNTKEPVVLRRDYPIFQGALVVCDGGENPEVRLLITKAVSALTGLGADKITVCK